MFSQGQLMNGLLLSAVVPQSTEQTSGWESAAWAVLFSSFAGTLQGAQLPPALQWNSQALRKQTASISYLQGNNAWGCFGIWDCRVVHWVNPGTPTGRMWLEKLNPGEICPKSSSSSRVWVVWFVYSGFRALGVISGCQGRQGTCLMGLLLGYFY